MCNFFRKDCFLILVSFWTFYYTIVYLKWITFVMNFERKKLFHFQNSRPYVLHKKVAQKILSKFTCNLIKKETPAHVYFVNLAKLFKSFFLQNSCEWLVLDFAQFYKSHSIIYFIKRNSKKGNYYFLNVFNRISASENYRQKK